MKDFFNSFSLITQLGIFIICAIFIGLGIGRVLDKFFGFNYLFTIVFLLFGIIAAFMGSYRLIMKSK